MHVTALDHLVINVTDVARSAQWYASVLGVEIEVAVSNGRTSLHFGAQKINLRPVTATQEEWFTGRAPQPGSDDMCFLTDVPVQEVAEHLQDLDVEVELGPVRKVGAVGPILSVYCRDPDGNLVEIANYRDVAPKGPF